MQMSLPIVHIQLYQADKVLHLAQLMRTIELQILNLNAFSNDLKLSKKGEICKFDLLLKSGK